MCNPCMPISDEVNATDDFADHLLNMLNQEALSLMVSIGHRTGLFDSIEFEHTAETDGFDLVTAFDAIHDQVVPKVYSMASTKRLKNQISNCK